MLYNNFSNDQIDLVKDKYQDVFNEIFVNDNNVINLRDFIQEGDGFYSNSHFTIHPRKDNVCANNKHRFVVRRVYHDTNRKLYKSYIVARGWTFESTLNQLSRLLKSHSYIS